MGLIEGVRDDESLVLLIQSGDSVAFDELVRRYLPKVMSTVRKLVPPQDVDDVTQDIFVSVMTSIHQSVKRSYFSLWLRRVVLRRVADYYRSSARWKGKFVPEDALEPSEEVVEIGERVEIQELLSKLPPHYREVLVMRFWDDLTHTEISRELDLTYEATRSRYRRGIEAAAEVVRKEWC